MHRFIAAILALLFAAGPLYADDQTAATRQQVNELAKSSHGITKLTAKTGVVYKIQTAVGYVTTIELPSEALKVFVGDQDQFSAEVYGNEVVIKPATDYPDARTDLTVYFDKTRLSFDVTVGSPETVDVVLDFRYPTDEALVDNAFKKKLNEKEAILEAKYQEKLKDEDSKVKGLAQAKFEEDLKNGAKLRRFQMSRLKDGIQLNLLSLSVIGERNYLRFSVVNRTQSDFSIARIILGREKSKEAVFAPIDFAQNIDPVVPKGSFRYGLVSFDPVLLNSDEKLIFRLYEKDKTEPIEISEVPLEA